MLRSLTAGVILAALWLAGPLSPAPARAEPLDFVLVAHADIPVDTLTIEELGRIYKKEVTRWPDGTPIVPVELGGTASTRAAFYRTTLRLMMGDVTAYWINQAMTTGSNPPKMFSSDNLVMRFVRQTPGAVGFVSPGAHLDPLVKRIGIQP